MSFSFDITDFLVYGSFDIIETFDFPRALEFAKIPEPYRGGSLGSIVGLGPSALELWQTVYGRVDPKRDYGWEWETWHLPELWGPGPSFTVPQDKLKGVDMLLAALRVLAGLVNRSTLIPDDSTAQSIITNSEGTLGPEIIQQARDQVDTERQALETRVRARDLLEEPPTAEAIGRGPGPSLPGQHPVGYNPNDPYLPGSNTDPAGKVDPRLSFPSGQDLRELLEALGIEVPDPNDPAVVKQVILYWLGRLYNRYQRIRYEQLVDEMQEKQLILRQLELQRWIMYFRSLPATFQFFNARSLEGVAELGVPTELPKRAPEFPKPLPVIVCGFEEEDEECLTGNL